MFGRVLVANRGEVAVRVLRALRELEIPSVAVYSEADAAPCTYELADEAVLLGPAPAAESYLNIDAVLAACRQTGCDALHPGYGFLSENAEFVARCRESGIAFVGPDARSRRVDGRQDPRPPPRAGLGLPVVPGSTEAVTTADEAQSIAAEVGYPVAVKAAGGGGGMAFRVAHDAEELGKALASVRVRRRPVLR